MSNDNDKPGPLHYVLVGALFLYIVWSAINLINNIADEHTVPLPTQQEKPNGQTP